MMRLLVLLLALGACDQVFGLDERPPPPPGLVTGSVLRRYVTNNAMGLPDTIVEPHPPGTVSLAVTIGDARRVSVPVESDGTFSFARPDAETPYRLQVVADGKRTEYQHTAATLILKTNSVGRPNDQRIPVTMPTLLEFRRTPTAPRVVSTGLWTATQAAENEMLNYVVDWQTAVSLSGRRGLLTQVHHASLYMFDYTLRPEGYSTVGSYLEIPNAELLDGAYHDYVGRVLTVATPTSCVHLAGSRASDLARFTATQPGLHNTATDWTIAAVPDLAFGGGGGITIAFQRDTMGTTTDTIVNLANPIRGSSLVATMGVSANRPVAVPGATAVPLLSSLRSYASVAGQLPCSGVVDLTSSVAIPTELTFDGIALATTDDAVISPNVREALQLTWLVSPGPVDVYSVAIYEMFENVDSGLTNSRLLREILTLEPTAIIDAGLLVQGNYYVFVVTAATGASGSRDGDMTSVTYPIDVAQTTSGLFVVE